jgi:hypothetical protein
MVMRCGHRFLLAGLLALAASSAARAQDGLDLPGRWTWSAGLGSSRAWNLVGVTVDLPLSEHASAYLAAGLGEMVVGAGVAWFENRSGDGMVASVVAGTGLQASLTYRWRLRGSGFLVAGATYVHVAGFSNADHPQLLPVVAYECRF